MFPGPAFDMKVKAVIAGVESCPFKPSEKRTAGIGKDLIPPFFPEYSFSSVPPECFRIIDRLPVYFIVAQDRNSSSP
jgi:hypothetical protein